MSRELPPMDYSRLSLVEGYDEGREVSKDYARSMMHSVVEGYDELGLDKAFLPILESHVDDLYLTHSDKISSSLTVLPDNSTHECSFVRVANISDGHLKEYFVRLNTAARNVGTSIGYQTRRDNSHNNEAFLSCAAEWIFLELMSDAANNSCRMQEVFDGYVPDYNGQANCNLAETTISRNFFKADPNLSNEEYAIRQDTNNFRAGVALLFLRNSLVKHGVTNSINHADWIINDLRNDYPSETCSFLVEPLSAEGIENRLRAMKPNDTKIQMARFIATLDPLDEFLYD